VEWFYVKMGACSNCNNDHCRIYAPRIPSIRIVLAPQVCSTCRDRYEAGQSLKHHCPKCMLPMVGPKCETCLC
jgi:hypothetical protein